MRRISIVLVLLLAAAPALAAGGKGRGHEADRPERARHARSDPDRGGRDDDRYESRKGGERDRDRHESGGRERERDDGWRPFSDDDRRWWRSYWQEQYAKGHCPPGLAKKRNGCLPPGLAKKRYVVGRPLPRDVVVLEVPPHLLHHLPPPEPGYRYGLVDGDLLKLAVGSALVVDALVGLLD
jgi:hypothetical protein